MRPQIHDPALRERFELVRRLGIGGMGEVWEARDHLFHDVIALKFLLRVTEQALKDFRWEFRSLAELNHPNLAELYELYIKGPDVFYTMELCAGTVGERFRPKAPSDHPTNEMNAAPATTFSPLDGPLDPLFSAFAGAAKGLQELHVNGKLHRDIKPMNILLRTDGTTVLGDTGLAVDLDASDARGAAGTLHYMAPELLRGRPSPASDWFALGVSMFQLLAGAPPLGDDTPLAWALPGGGVAPTLSEVGIRVPEELETLIASMLAGKPERRPGGEAVLALLCQLCGETPGPTPVRRSVPFVGRDQARAELGSMLRQKGPWLVHVEGAPGVGKTALLQEALRESSGEAQILRGHSRPQEYIPYRSMNRVVESLGRLLEHLPTGERPTEHLSQTQALLRIFPDLALVRWLRCAEINATIPLDEVALRRSAFLAFRTLLGELARTRTLILWIEDVQWMDLDSIQLLTAIFSGPAAPPIGLILSARPGASPSVRSALSSLWGCFAQRRHVALEPLTLKESARLVSLANPTLTLSGHELERAGGEPEILLHLAEAVGKNALDENPARSLLLWRLRDIPDNARALQDAVAISASPVEPGVLQDLTDPPRHGGRSHLRLLCNRKLTRLSGENRLSFEYYSDRLRQARVEMLSPEERAALHNAFLEPLLRSDPPNYLLLFTHARGAGQKGLAARCAIQAARATELALAFDNQVELYTMSIQLEETREGYEGLATALRNAGRPAESARAYLRAAELCADDPSSNACLRRQGAEQQLRAGLVDEGLATFGPVLQANQLALPSSPGRAIATAWYWRLRFMFSGLPVRMRRRPRAEVRPPEQLELMWSVSTAFSMLNPTVTDAFGVRHLIAAIDLGEPSRISRALGFEASFEALLGIPYMLKRAHRIADQARQLAEETGDAYDLAWANLAKCIVSGLSGEFESAVTLGREAERIWMERCAGTWWELMVARTYINNSLAWLGDVRTLTQRVPEGLEDARHRGDLPAEAIHRLGQGGSMAWLCLDHPEAVLAEGDLVFDRVRTPQFHAIEYYHLLGTTTALLYQGDAAAAQARLDAGWGRMKGAGFLTMRYCAVEMAFLSARVMAATGNAPARKLQSTAKEVERASPALRHARGLACAIRALGAQLERDPVGMNRHLLDARVAFADARLVLLQRAAEWRLALLNRQEDQAWETLERVRALGVVRPERLLATLLPLGSSS